MSSKFDPPLSKSGMATSDLDNELCVLQTEVEQSELQHPKLHQHQREIKIGSQNKFSVATDNENQTFCGLLENT